MPKIIFYTITVAIGIIVASITTLFFAANEHSMAQNIGYNIDVTSDNRININCGEKDRSYVIMSREGYEELLNEDNIECKDGNLQITAGKGK